SQLMIDHVPFPDFTPQRLIHSRQFFGRILHFPCYGLDLVVSNFNSGQRAPISKFVLDSCTDGGQLLGGLLYQFVDVLALLQHLGEELSGHGLECRGQN
ncbi:MAG: hypothetical protein ACHQDB_04035, partial [Steroidobacterales bacterium]